ncbi:MAG: gliding motility-associated C-terminal domain-containing protein [Bacteroidales bacterium]|nr:gliding motility-associated C-terminal domain-containing protein [Bacteroidales bacterium]
MRVFEIGRRLVVCLLLLILCSVSVLAKNAGSTSDIDENLVFEQNLGQIVDASRNRCDNVFFKTEINGATAFFTNEGVTFSFSSVELSEYMQIKMGIKENPYSPEEWKEFRRKVESGNYHGDDIAPKVQSAVLRMQFPGANLTKAQGEEKMLETRNYFTPEFPDGLYGVPTFQKIRYSEVYPNVDLLFYIENGQLKYDFEMSPNANLSDIKLSYVGQKSISLDENGNVAVVAENVKLYDHAPKCYQDGELLDSRFYLDKDTIKFEVDGYDRSKGLIIDPELTWSTYFYDGSSTGITLGSWVTRPVWDSQGNMFISASTYSNAYPLVNPGSPAYYQSTPVNSMIVITKFNTNKEIVWSTYYCGTQWDILRDGNQTAVIDKNDNLYIAGEMSFPYGISTPNYFPLYNPGGGAYYEQTYNNSRNVIIEFNTVNCQRLWATVFSSVNSTSSGLVIKGLDIDENNNLVVTGTTYTPDNSWASIPLANPGGSHYYKASPVEEETAFLARFNGTNHALNWSTYISQGGSGAYVSSNARIAIDSKNNIYVVSGYSSSTAPFTSVNPGGSALVSSTLASNRQVTIYKFAPAGNMVWATLFGGTSSNTGSNIPWVDCYDAAVDGSENLIIVGRTPTTNFPIVNPGGGAFVQSSLSSSGKHDGFISKFNSSCQLIWSTYIGGATTTYDGNPLLSLAVDKANNLYVSGLARTSSYPLHQMPGSYYQSTYTGSQSVTMSQFDANGVMNWSTYLGNNTYVGNGGFNCRELCGDKLVRVGYTNSSSGSVTTINANGYVYYNAEREGTGSNDFIAEFSMTNVLPDIDLSGIEDEYCLNSTPDALPTSVNGIEGTWSPSAISTSAIVADDEYVFTPTSPCYLPDTLYVDVINCCNLAIESTSYSNPSCYGADDGTISVTVSGGTAPYTYLWSDNTSETTNETTAQLSGLGAGAYSVTVTDVNGCQSGGVRENTTECFRITDILYNSCDGSAEGYNEMVTLLVGPNDLDADNMNISWSTSGVSFTGFCENASIVAGINASITGGGRVIAPTNGILPANSEVLIVTSTRFEYESFDFSGLDHDVYILFQCNTSVTTGHFGNSVGNTRNFSVSFTSPSCSDAVSYNPPSDENGNAVHYNADGTSEYYNNGCLAPVFFDEILLSEPDEITLSYSSISGYQDVEIAATAPVTNCSGTSTYTATGLPAGLSINSSTGVISGTPTAQSSGNIEVTLSCDGCETTYNVGYTITEQPDLSGCIIDEDFAEITTGTIASPGGTELAAGSISDFPTTSKAYPAGGVVKLGSSSAAGYIQTAALNLSVPFYVEFDVKGWTNVEGNIVLTVSGGQTQTVTYTATRNDDFETKRIDFNAATASSTVRIATSAKRAFIDNVRVCYPSACSMTATARQTSGVCTGNIGIEVEASDGTGELTYAWNNGAGTAAQFNNAVSGTTYNVTVTDEANCTATASVTPLQTGEPVITPSFNPIACNGGTTTITLNVSGGVGAPYTYLWAGNTNTTNEMSGVTAGTYNVTVSDANCSATSSIRVGEPDVVTFAVSSTPQVCNTLGTATVSNVQGGNGSYNYLWSNSSEDASVEVVSGNYNVTVSDGNDCSASATVSVGSNPTSVSFVATPSNPNCYGETGSIAVTNIVGTADYSIAWTGGSQSGISSNSYTISNLDDNTYSVTVTDANGCSATQNGIEIEVPEDITFTVSQVEQVCATPGSITLENVSGGAGGYTFEWQNSANEPIGDGTNVLSGVNAGVYNITVTDASSCTKTEAITLTSSSGSVSFTPVSHDLLCYADGSGRIEVQSITGNSPYSVSWSSSAANDSRDNITASQFDITNLPAGNYTVVVTDANQCSHTATAAVAEHDSLAATATLTAPIKCHGDEFGVTAAASGGYLQAGHNYSYHWNNNVNVQTQNNLSEYGTYFVTVSDDNGCEATASVGAVEPAQLQIAIVSDAILCNGQTTTVTVTGTGGTGAYSGTGTFENISASATPYTYTITDENNCSASDQILVTEPDALSVAFSNIVAQTCQTLGSVDFAIVGGTGNISYSWDGGNIGAYTSVATANLPSGTHSISVSDANGCSTEQTVNIGSGVSMSLSVPDTTHVLCNGGNNGAFSIDIDNGTSPYSISWTSGVFVENSSSHAFEDLLAGTYSVTVNDANGCSASASVVITEPQPLVASSPAAQILCHGGNATVTVSAVGGVSPYQNTGTYTLSAGDYDYVVTDANGCQSSVHVHLADPSALSVTATTVDAQCNGGNGSAHLQISGGSSPYSVQWQDNSIGVNNTHLPVNTNFGYTVTDRNGCTEQGSVSVSQPESLVLELSSDSVSCYRLADGNVTIAALSGGTQPYSYSWNNGYHGNALSGVASGNYTLTVSDAHGCSITANAMVSQPSELSVVAMATNVNCGVSAGSLRLNVFGGTSPYTYVWSNGSQSDTQTDITEGVYSVTVADENGCSATSSANVGIIGSIAVSIDEVSPISCYGMSDASISVVAENVQMPAFYMWDNGLVGTTLTGLDAGSYSVTVSDAWGCLGTASHRIVSPTEITIVSHVVNPLCFKSADGAIAVEVGGGRPPYSYMWTNGSTGGNLANISAGVYGLVVTDYEGCTIRQTFTLTAPQEIGVVAEVTDASCYGQANGTITISAAGGVEPYTYGVGNNATMQDEGFFEHLAAGIYNAVASDANGCIAYVQVSVSQPEQIYMSVVVTEPTCRDRKDGKIEILASGGALPYEYALDSNVSDTSLFEGLGTGMYSVVVTDANGCFVIERGIVVPLNYRDCIEIPDVFTPNGDGINDEWVIENIDMFPEAHIYVFNRWGQLLYKGRGNDAPWDGRFRGHYVPAGVYTYIVELDEDMEKFEGTVTVLY